MQVQPLGREDTLEYGNPLHCLENSKHRGAWQVTIHGAKKNQTQLHNWAHPFTKITCILTLPLASLEQFLRAIWGAVSWAAVLLLPKIQQLSAPTLCTFVLGQHGRSISIPHIQKLRGSLRPGLELPDHALPFPCQRTRHRKVSQASRLPLPSFCLVLPPKPYQATGPRPGQQRLSPHPRWALSPGGGMQSGPQVRPVLWVAAATLAPWGPNLEKQHQNRPRAAPPRPPLLGALCGPRGCGVKGRREGLRGRGKAAGTEARNGGFGGEPTPGCGHTCCRHISSGQFDPGAPSWTLVQGHPPGHILRWRFSRSEQNQSSPAANSGRSSARVLPGFWSVGHCYWNSPNTSGTWTQTACPDPIPSPSAAQQLDPFSTISKVFFDLGKECYFNIFHSSVYTLVLHLSNLKRFRN